MARRILLLLVLCITVLPAAPIGAHEPTDDRLEEIDHELHQLRHEIEGAQGRQTEFSRQLAATEARVAELGAQVEAARAAVETIRAEIVGVEADLDQTRSDLTLQREQLAATQEEIRLTRDLIRRRAVELYTEGSSQFSGIILAFEEVSQLAIGLEYASQVIASSEQLVTSLEVLERQEERQKAILEQRQMELEEIVATLEIRRADLEAKQAELEAAEAAVQAERDRQRALLGQVKEEIAHFEGEVAALEEEQERIRAEILARQQAGGQRPGGVLLWPTSGGVTSGFGYRIHPISGVRKLHTGLDIGGGYGQSIVAAASGKVILASWYGGYGNAVVIDHGGGLATLYAHQSRMAVGVGQTVSAGQVIGYVGSSGYSTGPHLHFEVRENGVPVNPMGYL